MENDQYLLDSADHQHPGGGRYISWHLHDPTIHPLGTAQYDLFHVRCGWVTDLLPLISRIEQPILAALLSLSAGAPVYVGDTHLLPRSEQEHRRFSLVALAGGVLIAVIIIVPKA